MLVSPIIIQKFTHRRVNTDNGRVLIVCNQCGKQKMRLKSTLKQGGGKFCSHGCTTRYYQKQKQQKYDPMFDPILNQLRYNFLYS